MNLGWDVGVASAPASLCGREGRLLITDDELIWTAAANDDRRVWRLAALAHGAGEGDTPASTCLAVRAGGRTELLQLGDTGVRVKFAALLRLHRGLGGEVAEEEWGGRSRPATLGGLPLGVRVACGEDRVGDLRYVGPVHFAGGEWCGVELDIPAGRGDGAVGGRRYFRCRAEHALFVASEAVGLERPSAALAPAARVRRGAALGTFRLAAPLWDEGAGDCLLCRREFGLITRRHHCRNCGALVCGGCSPGSCALPHFGYFEPERVCVACAKHAAVCSRASGLRLNSGQLGLVSGTEARAAQLLAAQRAAETAHSASAREFGWRGGLGVFALLVRLPTDVLQVCGARGLAGLAALEEFHPEMVRLEVPAALAHVACTMAQGHGALHAVTALSLIAGKGRHTAALLDAGVLGALLPLLTTEAEASLRLFAAGVIRALCRHPEAQQKACSDGAMLRTLLGAALKLAGEPRTHECCVEILGNLTVEPANALQVWRANRSMGDALAQLVAQLSSRDAPGTSAASGAHGRALTHLACVLANFAAITAPPGLYGYTDRTAETAALCALVRHRRSDEFREHVVRGLLNVSSDPSQAPRLLAELEHIVFPLAGSGSRTLVRSYIVRALANLQWADGPAFAAALAQETRRTLSGAAEDPREPVVQAAARGLLGRLRAPGPARGAAAPHRAEAAPPSSWFEEGAACGASRQQPGWEPDAAVGAQRTPLSLCDRLEPLLLNERQHAERYRAAGEAASAEGTRALCLQRAAACETRAGWIGEAQQALERFIP